MSIEARTRHVFGGFHNLNLLSLRENLRSERVAHGAWLTGGLLCPVAHGLPSGRHVREVIALGVADLMYGCEYAARLVGTDPTTAAGFVAWWDGNYLSTFSLLQQLDELWRERLADADAVQNVLQGASTSPLGG